MCTARAHAYAHTRHVSDDRPMSAPIAELSSLSTALDELTRRVGSMAEAADAEKDKETSSELFAVERALRGAHRRLQKLTAPRRPSR
jgi:hypothetical protein